MIMEKPKKEELEVVLTSAIGEGSESEWKERFIISLTKLLTQRPLSYRAYGPYWWGIKKVLIASGETGFGESIDVKWHDIYDCGSDSLNLIAGFCYAEPLIEKGKTTTSEHILYNEDSDPVEYVVIDKEMEMLDIAKRML